LVKGSLVVVGTGISAGHVTLEARSYISSAQKVLYCVADVATERLILDLKPDAESLYVLYAEGKPRRETYQQMTDRTLECVREGLRVCVAYYGHPGIFVNPSHRSIRAARAEGFSARMVPAVSSLDCLFCDLGIDPSTGCQMYEATDLVLRQRQIDTSCHMILWQVAATGDLKFSFKGFNNRNTLHVVDYLLKFYPPEHELTIYEAAQYSVCEPIIEKVKLGDLGEKRLTGVSTLYVPPRQKPRLYLTMLNRLGLSDFLEGKQLVPVNGAEVS
jgi:uncharacterized protein YabN with tetrapyrrole methylase and pyrophosphatase domain